MNRSSRAEETGLPLRQQQMGSLRTSMMKEKEDELALFLEMRKREKERNNLLLLHNSDDFDAPLERMASMMCVDVDLNADGDLDENETKLSAEEIVENELLKLKEGPTDALGWLEFDELDVDDSMLVFLDLPSKFPKLIALSLMGNKLKDVDTVLKEITQLKHLRALWLNDNPVLESGGNHLADSILLGCPDLEVYNSRFTAYYGKWALGFCGGLYRKGHERIY